MEDLTSKITELLQSPDSVEQIKAMAASLMGNSNNNETTNKSSQPILEDLGGLGDIDVGSLMRVASILKNSGNDNRSGLLLALKPHLSEERQPRVDKAIKILKLVSLIPIFREQGILNF